MEQDSQYPHSQQSVDDEEEEPAADSDDPAGSGTDSCSYFARPVVERGLGDWTLSPARLLMISEEYRNLREASEGPPAVDQVEETVRDEMMVDLAYFCSESISTGGVSPVLPSQEDPAVRPGSATTEGVGPLSSEPVPSTSSSSGIWKRKAFSGTGCTNESSSVESIGMIIYSR
jgi:hypothetical protein